MAHAVVIQVKVDADSDVAHRHGILHEYVIPAVKTLPGFQKGAWMNDGVGTGMCIVVFDTEENAKAAVTPLTPPGGPAVISSAVYTVEIEAERDPISADR
jgi:hypothetical protein